MSTVRQAHLPGNYEIYDLSANYIGQGVCKGCWEDGRVMNTSSLQTVWVEMDGTRMAWWLCKGHADALKTNPGEIKLLKSEDRVIPTPRIW
jgi:hypothetical protein